MRRRPFFEELQRMMDESGRENLGRIGGRGWHARRACCDMTETDDEVILTIELPGVKKEDIKINAAQDEIEVSVEEKEKKEEKGEGYYKAGTRYVGFHSVYPTASPIDPNAIDAKYTNGVLEIRAKKVVKKKGKEIVVR